MFTFTREELGWKPEEEKVESQKSPLGKGVIRNLDGSEVNPKEVRWMFEDKPTLGEFTGKMLGSGMDQTQALLYGAGALAADLGGAEELRNSAMEGYTRNMQDAAIAREDAGAVGFTEIEGFGDAAKWAYGVVLEQLPQLAPTIALGGVGGLAGKQLVKKGIQEAVEEGVKAGLTKEAAEAAVANAVASRGGVKAFLSGTTDKAAAKELLAGGFTREATEQSLGRVAAGKIAPQAGAVAGGQVSAQATSTGSIYGDTEDPELALKYGVPAGALEGVGEAILLSPFARRAFGVGTQRTQPLNLATLGKGFAGGAVIEGPLTELPQTTLEQAARAQDKDRAIPFDPNSPEATAEKIEATAAGALFGGGLGAAGRVAPRTLQAFQELSQRRLSDPETGLPEETQQPPPSLAFEYENESYDIGDGIVGRRFKIKGTDRVGYAIDNPSEETLQKYAGTGYVDNGRLILPGDWREGSASATLGVRIETARAKALGKISDEEKEEEAAPPPKKEELEIKSDPIEEKLNIPKPEATGLTPPEPVEAKEPVDAKPEPAKEAIPPTTQDGQTVTSSGSYPEDAGSTPAPANENKGGDSNEQVLLRDEEKQGQGQGQVTEEPEAKVEAVLATPEVEAVEAAAAVPDDPQSAPILADAETLLRQTISDIERRMEESNQRLLEESRAADVEMQKDGFQTGYETDAKRVVERTSKETEAEVLGPLREKLDKITKAREQSESLDSGIQRRNEIRSGLETEDIISQKLEEAKKKDREEKASQKQAQTDLLENRTPEQTSGLVASLAPGTNIVVDLGSSDIEGTFQGTTDEGLVVVKNKKTKKTEVAPPERVVLATDKKPEPTFEGVIQESLGPEPTEKTVKALGFKPTGSATTEKIGDTVYTNRPTYEIKRKDRIAKDPVKLTATFYKDAPNLHHVYDGKRTPRPTKATRQADVRDMLRAMDQGHEVRVPNAVQVPDGIQTQPVEGTDYRIVTGIDFQYGGVNYGTFLWGNGSLIHNGTERRGVFAEAWDSSPERRANSAQRSKETMAGKQERGSDASTKAAERAGDLNTAQTAILSAILGPYQTAVTNYLNNQASGLDLTGQESFRAGATNKLINAISKTKAPEVDRKTAESIVKAYFDARDSSKNFSGGGKLTQATVNGLVKTLTGETDAKNPQVKLVKGVIEALQQTAMLSNPRTRTKVLLEVAETEYKQQASRPRGGVSLDEKKGEDGTETLESFITVQTPQQSEERPSGNQLAAEQGELSNEEKARVAEQKETAKAKAEEIKGKIDLDDAFDNFYETLTPIERAALMFELYNTPQSREQFYELLEIETGVNPVTDPGGFNAAARDIIQEVSRNYARSLSPQEFASDGRDEAGNQESVGKTESAGKDDVGKALAEKAAKEAQAEKASVERVTKKPKPEPAKPQPATDWVSSLTPDEKFAYDYLRETDPDKKQSMLDEFEAAKFEAAGATDPDTIKVPRSGPKRQAALEAKEQATLAWNRAISRVQDESQKLIGGVYSKMRENEAPESRGKAQAAAASPGAAASGLPRSSRTAEIRRIKRRFVQSKAGLTDEQTAAITDDEIDRAYFAFNSQADEKKAAAAQDAVVSVAAGVEQFTALNSADLLQEYYKEIDAALKAGDMDRVRNANFKELVRLGAFLSTREFLSRLADKNNKAPRDLQIRAKAFLNLEKRGYKLENIEIQAANFRKTGTTERSRWGGLLGRDADYSKFGIYLNLDQAHDRASIANTALHELAHATTLAKVHGKIKTTKEEQKAVSDLEAMRRRALLRAGDASPTIKAAADAAGITDPKERSDFYQKAIATLVNNDPAFRDFNGLKNLDEFIVEITGSPDFLKLLGKLGFGKADQEKRTFTGMVRDAFLAILKLLGTDINPNSELGKAFFDSWNLVYAGSKPVAKPSELLQSVRGVQAEAKSKAKPEAAKPEAAKPEAAKPEAAKPEAAKPEAAKPEAAKPEAAKPEAAKPEAAKPEAAKPESNNPVTKRGKGRPKREVDPSKLPFTAEQVEEELAKEGMEEDDAPQSPAAAVNKNQPPLSKLTQKHERDIAKVLGERTSREAVDPRKAASLLRRLEQNRRKAADDESGAILAEAAKSGIPRFPDTPLKRISEKSDSKSGQEHFVFLPKEEDGRVVKVTKVGPDGRFEGISFGENTPANYANRIATSNQEFGADILVLGVIKTDQGWAFVTSHPFLETDPSIDIEENRVEIEKQLHEWMTGRGFLPFDEAELQDNDIAYDYYNPKTGVGVTDIGPDNVQVLIDPSDPDKYLFRARDLIVGKFKPATLKKAKAAKEVLYDISPDDMVMSPGLDTARWNELTADLQGRDLTQADLDAWKKANPEKYAELERMREDALKAAGYNIGPVYHGTPTKNNFTVFNDKNEQANTFDESLKFFTDDAEIADFAYEGDVGHTKKVFLRILNPQILETPSALLRQDVKEFKPTEQNVSAAKKMLGRPDINNFPIQLREFAIKLASGNSAELPYLNPVNGRVPASDSDDRLLTEVLGFSYGNKQTQGLSPEFDGAIIPPSAQYPSDPIDRIMAIGRNKDAERFSTTYAVRGSFQIKSAEPLNLENGRLVPPTEWAQPENPDIAYSPAGDALKQIAKLTGKETKVTYTGGTYQKGGLFSTDGSLDKRAGDLWRRRNMRVGAQERMVGIAANKLVNAVKNQKKPVNTELMNTALGNLDNPLTQAQRRTVRQYEEIDEQLAREQEAAFISANREAFKVRQAEALRQLPTEVAVAVSEMTEHITALSSALKEAGVLEPGLAATVDANLGIYLHRSYEIFDNPKWGEKVRKNKDVMRAAQSMIRRQIERRNAEKLVADTSNAGGLMTLADAQARTRGTATREEVDRVIESLLAAGEDSLGGVILRGRLPGQKDLSLLDARGNIAPEIQALWGRYEDPTINYAKSVMKVSSLLANHQFLKDVRSLGLQEGWLFEGEDHPPGYLKVSSDNNKSLAPLSGLYANRDFLEALYAMYPPAGIAENYEWVKFFAKLTGASMASKTVLSAASHVRNFAGNFLNLAASGNLGITDIFYGGRFKKAFDLTMRSTFSNMSAQQFKDTIKELVELGVLNESLTSGLLKDLLATKRIAASPMQLSEKISDLFLKRPAAAVWDTAQKSYSSSDEFFKVVIYLSEMDKYRKAMPSWSEQQLKENAAKIARDVHWTYSLAPVGVNKLKSFPFIAPFITFTTEVIRTTKNTMALAYQEIKEGGRTGNKALADIGWKRVRGMSVAAFAPTAATAAFATLAGVDGEDDDDLRRFLPNWQKNSQLLVLGNDSGKINFVDISYLDPYEYWKRPVIAFMRALGADNDDAAMQRITQGAVDAGVQLLNPFAAEQILSGALLDIARNQTSDGKELWNPQDTGTRVAGKIADHLWNAMEPGTITSFERIYKAGTGNISDSGRAYGTANEIASVLLGQRISQLDVSQALGFKASEYSRNLRDASALFTREFSSRGTRSPDQIVDAYNRANDQTFELGKNFRQDLLAAIRLGRITQKRADEILRAGRLSAEDVRSLRTGRYLRYTPSPQQIKLARELGNQERIQAARQAERDAPAVMELR